MTIIGGLLTRAASPKEGWRGMPTAGLGSWEDGAQGLGRKVDELIWDMKLRSQWASRWTSRCGAKEDESKILIWGAYQG